jgi:predicted transposase YbfD/YdcC
VERVDPRTLPHQNRSHYVRDANLAEDASRIRKNPDIAARLRSFAYCLLRAGPTKTSKTPDGAPRSTSTTSSK